MPRFPLIPTVVVLAAVATMIALGFWQLGRLGKKEALIASYERAMADPQPTLGSPRDPAQLFRRIETYCDNPTLSEARAGRNADGQSGWIHVVMCEIGGPDPATPIEEQLPDYVLEVGTVVIGWSREPKTVSWQGGPVAGLIGPGGRIWVDKPVETLEPLAQPDPSDLPNNHLAYAVQWFLFAATALVIYVLALRRKQRGG